MTRCSHIYCCCHIHLCSLLPARHCFCSNSVSCFPAEYVILISSPLLSSPLLSSPLLSSPHITSPILSYSHCHFTPTLLSTASPSMRGSTPLDVAAASVMDNNELALALREPDLEKVTFTNISAIPKLYIHYEKINLQFRYLFEIVSIQMCTSQCQYDAEENYAFLHLRSWEQPVFIHHLFSSFPLTPPFLHPPTLIPFSFIHLP